MNSYDVQLLATTGVVVACAIAFEAHSRLARRRAERERVIGRICARDIATLTRESGVFLCGRRVKDSDAGGAA